jgi:hypothetical protein
VATKTSASANSGHRQPRRCPTKSTKSEQCSPEDYQSYAGRIAQAMDAVNDALLNTAIAAHPELTVRIEADLKEFGRVR